MTNQDAAYTYEDIMDRDPRKFPFGYFAYSDAAPPFGGGIGGFLWASSERDAVRMLVEQDLPSHVPFRDADPNELAEVRKILAPVFNGDRSLMQVRKPLNKELENVVQIEWAGTFEDLTHGDDEFARKVRADFQSLSDDESPATGGANPISPEELDDFVEFLTTYGA